MRFLTEIFRTQFLSLIVIIEFKKKKERKKKKEKKSYTSCVSLSAHIVGLKHYQYYYLLTQDVRLGIYQVLHSSYYRITTNFTSIFTTIKYI